MNSNGIAGKIAFDSKVHRERFACLFEDMRAACLGGAEKIPAGTNAQADVQGAVAALTAMMTDHATRAAMDARGGSDGAAFLALGDLVAGLGSGFGNYCATLPDEAVIRMVAMFSEVVFLSKRSEEARLKAGGAR